MATNRRSFTHKEARMVLAKWLKQHKHTPVSFRAWLESHGVLVSRQMCHNLFHAHNGPGPKFKQVFCEITGIQLVDGLIEKDKA